MNENTDPNLAAPGLGAPRRWEWFIEGESGSGVLCSAEIRDGKLCWHIDADHDAHRGGEDSEQSLADFLAYGPETASPPEHVSREVAAHLGLSDPPWLRPLDPQIESFLKLARSGEVAGVERMLGAGMNVNAADRQSHTALWHAVDAGQAEAAQFLLDAGADVTRVYRHGTTLLMLAARKENLPLVRHLLARGLDVNARDENGANALLYSVSHNESPLGVFQALVEAGADGLPAAFVKAAQSGARDIVRYLVEMGVDVNARTADGWTPFLASLCGGYRPELAEELLAAGGDPRTPLPSGGAVLHVAALGGNRWLNALRAALRAGVDVNARDGQGQTALHTAARHGQIAAINLLLQFGADVNAREPGSGRTPLWYAYANNDQAAFDALVAAGGELEGE